MLRRQTPQVVREVDQPQTHVGALESGAEHRPTAAEQVDAREDVLDARTHFRPCAIPGLLLPGQWPIAMGFVLRRVGNAMPFAGVCGFLGAVSAVGVQRVALARGVEQCVQRLRVVARRHRDRIVADEAMLGIGIDVVLVPK